MNKLKQKIRAAAISIQVVLMTGFAAPVFATSTADFNNEFFGKIWGKLNNIYLDLMALSTVITAISLIVVLVGDFIIGDGKNGGKKVRQILIAYGALSAVMMILALVKEFVG